MNIFPTTRSLSSFCALQIMYEKYLWTMSPAIVSLLTASTESVLAAILRGRSKRPRIISLLGASFASLGPT